MLPVEGEKNGAVVLGCTQNQLCLALSCEYMQDSVLEGVSTPGVIKVKKKKTVAGSYCSGESGAK